MKVAFVTTQALTGSTVRGRILPLAEELAKQPHIYIDVIIHGPSQPPQSNIQFHFHSSGRDPFTATATGKVRLHGWPLIWRILSNVVSTARLLIRLKPDKIVIVKPLPENVLAVMLATWFHKPEKINLDVDDFELSANLLTSWLQRAAVHWSQRQALQLTGGVIVATPFLADHIHTLASQAKVTLIPTGCNLLPDLKHFSPSPRIVYMGSLSQTSGHRVDMLPDILAQLTQSFPSLTMHIFGTGDDMAHIQATLAAKHLSDKVTWHGAYTLLELPDLLSARDILIDPIDSSITNRAKSSSRVAVALACGLAIVTSNIGIRSQLIPSQFHARFFAAPGDSAAYAAKLALLIKEPISLADTLTLRHQAQAYTWESLAKTYLAQLL